MAIIVERGDTLSKLSKTLGVSKQELQDANKGVDFSELEAGQLLVHPEEKRDLVRDALALGYSDIDDLARRAKMSKAEVLSLASFEEAEVSASKQRLPNNILQEIRVAARQKKSLPNELLQEIRVAAQTKTDLPFDPVEVTATKQDVPKDILQEVSVKDKKKSTARNYLEEIRIAATNNATLPKATKLNTSKLFSEDDLKIIESEAQKTVERYKAKEEFLATEFARGLTFGAIDDIKALASDDPYRLAKIKEQLKRQKFIEENPSIADYALPLEILGAIPTGAGLSRALSKAGITSAAKQAGIEGYLYGGLSGDSGEERIALASFGGLGGVALGKVIDVATKRVSKGGLKSDADDLADREIQIEPVLRTKADEKAMADEVFEEVDNPIYATKPLAEAQTAGEFYEGVKGAVRRFYNDKIKGVSDALWSGVSPQVGARVQRADQAALVTTNKELEAFSEELAPVLQVINDDTYVKGVLLDYGKGSLSKLKSTTHTQAEILDDSINKLKELLANKMGTNKLRTLEKYLRYSAAKNGDLNKNVFGVEFAGKRTYLHTALSRAERKRLQKLGEIDDEQLPGLSEDTAFKQRTRGDYLNSGDRFAPDPANYQNPIITDMQRIFKLERLNQIQRVFGVDVDEMAKIKRSYPEEGALGYLTPDEFMDEFAYTLMRKGISKEGAFYTRQKVIDLIMGQDSTPHPVIQSLSSLSYATTLAGPMSAILNIADVPLVGAKYGGAAVREGGKVLVPKGFKTVPNADLKKLGISGQTFGEFVNRISDQVQNSNGFLMGMASAMRKGTDMLMKGSGFAALDQVGKQGVMRGVLKSAADDAAADNLAKNWGFYFNDNELKILTKQFNQHGDDWTKYTGQGKQLAEELMLAGLGQQQLISAAGRPAAWARHPNLRPLWALRGFVIKQQALALREVVGNIKKGNPEEAAKFLGRYAAYGAGGYAIINEGRQYIFGDGEMSASGLVRGYGDAWASLLTANTLGLNDYQYGQIKQNGILPTLAEGLMPIAITRPFEIGQTIVEAIDQERPPQAVLTEASPAVKQSLRLLRNISPEDSEQQAMFSELLRYRND